MITTVEETGSTNADLLVAATVGVLEGVWLRAKRQNAGRGRLGREWQSAEGNLYASTLIRLRLSDPCASGLGLLAAVALDDTVRTLFPFADGLQLKWPNDLMLGGAKLSGILLERTGDAVVIGFGVNIAFAPEVPGRETACLSDIGPAPEAATFLEALADIFAHWLAQWRNFGLAPVRARWLDRAHPIGTALTITGATPLTGLFNGLEPDGALRLRLAGGTDQIIHAGDIIFASGE